MLERYINDALSLISKSSKMSPSVRRKYLSSVFSKIYNENKKGDVDINTIIKIFQLENMLTERIISASPILEASNKLLGTDEQILEQVVFYTRKKFQDTYQSNVINDSLRDRSKDMCNILNDTCKTLNVICVIIDIGKKVGMNVSHYIGIILIKNKLYLIDCTYQQFFLLGYNFIDRYYKHPAGIKVCEVGGRMVPKRINTASTLMKNGYLECESDSFKEYLDAFIESAGNTEKKDSSKEYLELILFEINDKNINKILANI
jgi:hypothetical protein